MGEEVETTEAPNWLKELEAKRERRLKAKLGHEAGAGAPCLTCAEKCPGLDLHFWRKICKNCKCAKENHDVHDDDLYGWAQFQLLGSKPNKSRKFKLPGKKEEIILEWTPKGHNETVDKFLKNLPPELLPVRGSAAAQERKQLLQKQIPIHDIDPTLCHDLTEAELSQMNEYVAHIKQSSVGMGHVVQLGLNRGSKHVIGPNDGHVLANRYPAQLSHTQPVQLLTANNAAKLHLSNSQPTAANTDAKLAGRLQRMAVNVPEDVQFGAKPTQIHDVNYPTYERVKTPDLYLNYEVERANSPSFSERLSSNLPQNRHLQEESNVPPENLSGFHTKNLPHYAPGKMNTYSEKQAPQKIASVRDLAFSKYDPKTVQNAFENPNQNYKTPEALQQPSDLTNKNYRLPQNYPANFTVPQDTLNPTQVNVGANYNLPANYPANFTVPQDTLNETQMNVGANYKLPQNYPANFTDTLNPTQVNAGANYKLPQNYPAIFTVPQDTLNPTQVNVGAINDIAYPTADVKLAEGRSHDAVLPPALPQTCQPTDVRGKLLSCHRCKKPFEDSAIVIGIERSSALFHSSCFKCKGCNQNLADLVYFFDKDSDDIYCGRDYAKIRGIPRCKACDELIFVKEYCLAENSTFHVKHFCCFACDTPLADRNYVMEDDQPVCLPCFERTKANKCSSCFGVIKPDETGAKLNDLHFHVNDECFACKICRKPLLGGKLLLKNQRLYCSAVCYGVDKK